MSRVFLNGEIMEAEAARLAPSDRGFLLGDGAFETMRFENGAVRRWARHARRLEGALGFLQIEAPDFGALHAAAAELARLEGLDQAVIRLTLTRGAHGGGLDAPVGAPGTVLMTARARSAKPESVTLVTTPQARRAGLDSERFKLTGYAEPLFARRLARAAGGEWGVLCSADGRSVVCADCASLFVVSEGRVLTPPVSAGALPGTARAALMEAARAGGLAVEERAVARDLLASAEAVFVTNAVHGVVPASHLDGRALNPCHPAVLAAAALEARAD